MIFEPKPLSPAEVEERRKELYALSRLPGFQVLIGEIRGFEYVYRARLPRKAEDTTAFQTYAYVNTAINELLTHLAIEIGEGERLTRLDEAGEDVYAQETEPVRGPRPRA